MDAQKLCLAYRGIKYSKVSGERICTAVRFAMDQLGVNTLKGKQKEAIHNFVQGHAVLLFCQRVQKNVVLCLNCCHSCSTV